MKHDEHEILNCTICNQVKHLNEMATVDACNDCQKYTKALDIVRRLAKLPMPSDFDKASCESENFYILAGLINEARELEE